jgi:hypothetical protein
MPSNPSSPSPYVTSSQPRQVDDIIHISDDDSVSSNSDNFLDIDEILSQRNPLQKQVTPPAAPTSSRPIRTRKPTSKQASQNRRENEKKERRKAQLKKTVDTTQLDDYEFPFRSSQ